MLTTGCKKPPTNAQPRLCSVLCAAVPVRSCWSGPCMCARNGSSRFRAGTGVNLSLL